MSHILERVFTLKRRNTLLYMRQFFLRDYVKNAVRVFFLGIIVGILLIFLFRSRLQTDISVMNEEWILYIQNGQVNCKSLFVYILLKRVKELGIFVLMSTTFIGLICIYGYTALLGMGTGILMGVACLRYGVKGIVLVLAASFPQVLVYVPVFIYIFHLCYLLCVKLYFPHKDYWKSSSSTKVFLFKNVFAIIIAIVVVIIGILLESYVNPRIFFSYIKNF